MHMQATNISHGKLINLWVIFEIIRLHGPLSRSDVARLTKLSKPTVSHLVDELDRAGLIHHGAARRGGMGKPSTPVELNPDGAFTIGLHLDYGRATGVLTDLVGSVRLRQAWPLDAGDAAGTLAELARRVESLHEQARRERARLIGVGLVMPGPFGVTGLWPTRLSGWDGIALRASLEEKIGLPVMLSNDAKGATLAEWRFGDARRCENFAYVFIGNGIGTGHVMNGQLVGGAAGNDGELAHVVVRPGGHSCICGKRGCLETYVSLDSALRHLARHGVRLSSMEEFEAFARHDDPRIGEWIEAAIEPLRLGINAVENLFDPETTYLGGDFPGWLLDVLLERVQPLPISVACSRPAERRLRRAALGRDAAAIGAAAFAVAATLNPDCLR